MSKYKYILLIVFIIISCKANNKLENEELELVVESTIETSSSIETVEVATLEDKMLIGTWKLVETEAKLQNLISSVYLNFYEDMSFNKKVDGYYTPRVRYTISANSNIRFFNTQGSSDLGKILSLSTDTLKIYLNTDNALGVFARAAIDE
jgi:hypothetical protein